MEKRSVSRAVLLILVATLFVLSGCASNRRSQLSSEYDDWCDPIGDPIAGIFTSDVSTDGWIDYLAVKWILNGKRITVEGNNGKSWKVSNWWPWSSTNAPADGKYTIRVDVTKSKRPASKFAKAGFRNCVKNSSAYDTIVVDTTAPVISAGITPESPQMQNIKVVGRVFDATTEVVSLSVIGFEQYGNVHFGSNGDFSFEVPYQALRSSVVSLQAIDQAGHTAILHINVPWPQNGWIMHDEQGNIKRFVIDPDFTPAEHWLLGYGFDTRWSLLRSGEFLSAQMRYTTTAWFVLVAVVAFIIMPIALNLAVRPILLVGFDSVKAAAEAEKRRKQDEAERKERNRINKLRVKQWPKIKEARRKHDWLTMRYLLLQDFMRGAPKTSKWVKLCNQGLQYDDKYVFEIDACLKAGRFEDARNAAGNIPPEWNQKTSYQKQMKRIVDAMIKAGEFRLAFAEVEKKPEILNGHYKKVVDGWVETYRVQLADMYPDVESIIFAMRNHPVNLSSESDNKAAIKTIRRAYRDLLKVFAPDKSYLVNKGGMPKLGFDIDGVPSEVISAISEMLVEEINGAKEFLTETYNDPNLFNDIAVPEEEEESVEDLLGQL